MLVNCEKDTINNDVEPHQIAEINYKNLDELPEVAAALSEITASGRTSNRNASSRIMNTDFGNLSISNILEYVNNDGKETYTFKIEKEVDPLNIFSFENLHLVKVGDSYLAYILKWEPNHEWYENNNYNFEVQHFTGIQKHYDLDYNLLQETTFVNGQRIINSSSGRSSNSVEQNQSRMDVEITCVDVSGSLCSGVPFNCGGAICGFGISSFCSISGGSDGGNGTGGNDTGSDDESSSGGGTRIPRSNDTSNETDIVEDGGTTVVIDPLSLEEAIGRQLSSLLEDGDSYEFDEAINPNDAITVNSVEEFETYLNNNVTFEDDISVIDNQNGTHTSEIRVDLGLTTINLFINQILEDNSNNQHYEISSINSTYTGVTIGSSWVQGNWDYSVFDLNNTAILDINGLINYNLFLEGIGTVYTDAKKYRIVINIENGEILSAEEL